MSQALRSGEFDPTFGQGGHVDMLLTTSAGTLLPDQNILLIGALLDGVGIQVYRLLPNGRPDPAFGEAGVEVRFPHNFLGQFTGLWVMRQSSGKFVVAGTLRVSDIESQCLIARLLPNGRLDDTFGNAGITVVSLPEGFLNTLRRAIMLPDDKIVFGVECVISFNNLFEATVRLTPDGTFDFTFGEGGVARTIPLGIKVPYASLLPDGKMLIAGGASYPEPILSQPVVARYLGNGQPDPSFGTDGFRYFDYPQTYPELKYWEVTGLQPQSDGRTMIMGHCSEGSPFEGDQFTYTWFSRLMPDGATDVSFNGGELRFSRLTDIAWTGFSLVIQPDGKGLAAGPSLGRSNAVVERFEPDGAADPSFGDGGVFVGELPPPGGLWMPTKLMIQSDGKLLMLANTLAYPTRMRLSRMIL